MLVSVILRTYNHARYLTELLESIRYQTLDDAEIEIVLADYGSTDGTRFLSDFFKCRWLDVEQQIDNPIAALNVACREANGDILVFLDPLVIPNSARWLSALIEPLVDKVAVYSYGRLEVSAFTDFPKAQYLDNHFPEASQIPQYGSFCNNANAAILKKTWSNFRFDESLLALEDIQMVKDIGQKGLALAYVAEAGVFDIREEDFNASLQRHKKEGRSLQAVYPHIHFSLLDFFVFFTTAVISDVQQALKQGCLHANLYQILSGRLAEYWGAFLGHHDHREKSDCIKQTFLSPKKVKHKKI